ncbi:MAG: hypothetical protein M1818_005121 [Claussenomyces sp. TS43310]|nr:MAG: hypothetical protein M1818_005121 [Claussenomyces sp. TS43310]
MGGNASLVRSIRLICAVFIYATITDAVPTITFPINSQVPPVARVALPFNFTFSSSTFSSDLAISYALSSAPSWISLDGSSRRLYGVPTPSDANTAPAVEITATDSTGSVTMNTTLVVSGNLAPTVAIPLEDQLTSFGAYSTPSSLLYYPSTAFNITFNAETFSSSGLSHYAVTLDNTPLPSWVTFDGSTLSFTGITPDAASLIQPPQQFGIQLIASDVLGFAGVSIPFDLVVASHELTFSHPFMNVNASIGKALNDSSFRSTLLLDGVMANTSIVETVTAGTPDWLTFDKTTFSLSGMIPTNASSVNISVDVTDVYGDVANTVIFVNITDNVFASKISSLNATAGSLFSHNFSSSFLNPLDIDLDAQISPSTPWLKFDSSTLVLSGDIPSHEAPLIIRITLHATSKSTKASSTQDLTLNVVSSATTVSTSSIPSLGPTSTSGPPPTTETSTSIPTTSAKKGGLTKGKLAAAIAVPIVVALPALSLCLLLCIRRKRQAKSRSATPEKNEISRPIASMMHILKGSSANGGRTDDYDDANTDASWVSTKRHTTIIRRSQTASNFSGPLSSHIGDSNSSGRPRSLSENAMSQYQGSSWRSTQGSAYPTLASTTTSSGGRITRNFSRKAGVSELTRDGSSDISNALRENANSGNIGHPGNFRLSKSSIQQTPDFAYDAENIKLYRDSRRDSRRKTPNYLGGIPNIGQRLSGIGHGSRRSCSGSSLSSQKRYSRGLGIGHGSSGSGIPGGHGPAGHGLVRDSSSWLTIQTGNTRQTFNQRPQSTMSAVTESTDVLYPGEIHGKSIKLVPKSPMTVISSKFSESSKFVRPVSRRAGSSPFFGGSIRSRASSGGNSRKGFGHLDYDAPAIPNVGDTNNRLERAILRGLRDVPEDGQIEVPRDSLGISYGNVREGIQQLESLVSSYISPHFSDNDSRFRSADHSPSSQDEPNYEEGLPLKDSEFFDQRAHESPSSLRDSKDNSIQYEDDESPEIGQAVVERPSLLTPFASFSKDDAQAQNIQERFMPGPGRRPVSIEKHGLNRGLKTQKSLTASHHEGFAEHSAKGDGGNESAFL